MIIGKFGHQPFSGRTQAESFVNKYSVIGEVVECGYGFGVKIEPATCGLDDEQIRIRDLSIKTEKSYVEIAARGALGATEQGNQERSPYSVGRSDFEELRQYGLARAMRDCLAHSDELDSATADWLRKVLWVTEKKGEDNIYGATLGRLTGITRRLGIDLE
ncbi:hypothetical protein I3271_09295 [Photobacterium leiognathi]|uniref:hypothetical protein n=1 Tax=Photobacterium leiognathi TaxID=553611 RepID=UPI001EDF86C0|nr:hypothetical protein [Photobacterium leiognathi]MCG3884883.1 hypothetical protein [Photobacterium leiognathi]